VEAEASIKNDLTLDAQTDRESGGQAMSTKHSAIAATLGLASALSIGPAEAAKICKDALSATGTTRVQLSEASREARARDNAIKNWTKLAADTHGYTYKFWWRADNKKVECAGGTAKTKRCTATAKPCRVY
jgi:hypothetical protein